MLVKLDARDEFNAGYKYNDWEIRGVPLRIEIGRATLSRMPWCLRRRDICKEGKTFGVPVDGIVEATKDMLTTIQAAMLQRATDFREANTRTVFVTTTSSSRCSKRTAASSASTGPAPAKMRIVSRKRPKRPSAAIRHSPLRVGHNIKLVLVFGDR